MERDCEEFPMKNLITRVLYERLRCQREKLRGSMELRVARCTKLLYNSDMKMQLDLYSVVFQEASLNQNVISQKRRLLRKVRSKQLSCCKSYCQCLFFELLVVCRVCILQSFYKSVFTFECLITVFFFAIKKSRQNFFFFIVYSLLCRQCFTLT